MIAKPKPRLLEKRAQRAAISAIDKQERATCRQRSGGQCEVIYWTVAGTVHPSTTPMPQVFRRCPRRSSQNHHLIGGTGRRNKGRSILAAHRLDVCDRCHLEITNHVLVPVDGTQKEDAATVRYERIR